MRRLATALALLGILAIAAGCGGGSDSSTSSSGSTTASGASEGSSTDAADQGGVGSGSGATGGHGSQGQGGSGSDGDGSSSGGAEGPGLAEKAKPDTKGFVAPPGGDDSIQTFGGEPESSEEAEITAAMASFLRAMAAKDYAAICDGLSDANIGQIEQLMKLKEEAGTCPTILQKLLVGPTDEAQKAAEGTVYQVRVEGDNAFILFTPLGGTASYFVMQHDPDGWKSTSLSSGTPFDPGATP